MSDFKRRYKKIIMISTAAALCILIFSISALAAPMKQKQSNEEEKTRLYLPGAGINKVMNEFSDNADADDILQLKKSAGDYRTGTKQKEILATEFKTKEDTYNSDDQFFAYDEADVTEENYAEASDVDFPKYFDDVDLNDFIADETEEQFDDSVQYNAEDDLSEQTLLYEVSEETTDEAIEAATEQYAEEDVNEEQTYAEPVTEEETLAEFLEEQDSRIAEEAEAKKVAEDNASLGQTIANDACQYVGWLPYVWAGADLSSGVDCSGFTMAVYAKYGYSLAHASGVQSTQGRSVSLADAQPGDIVVYSGHVAMYIGGGQVVHAPHSGTTVSIDSVNMMPVLDVRRIID